MTDTRIQLAAAALRAARRERKTIAKISETFEIAGLRDAYAVAAENTRVAVESGSRIAGKKVGLTSPAVQQQLGVDQPDFGVLFTEMEFLDGDALPTRTLIQPKAEGEVAFVVGRDLDDATLSWGRFLRGIEYALPAIEIVDSAIQDWKITLVDTVADNASCGLYVLGTNPKQINDLALDACAMRFTLNNEIRSEGTGAACLGHPLLAAWWLAKTMVEVGQPLKAGDVVLSGALGPMLPVSGSDELCVEIAGLGTVSCRMD